jgi:hypothetical protein
MLHKLKLKSLWGTILIQALFVTVCALGFVLITENIFLGILMALWITYWDWVLEKILYKRSVRNVLAVLTFIGFNFYFYYNNQPAYHVFSTKILLSNAALIALIILSFYKPEIWRILKFKQQTANKELN